MQSITPRLELFHGIADDPASWLRLPEARFELIDPNFREWRVVTTRSEELSYSIANHYHPWAGELTAALLRGSVAGLQAVDTQLKPGATLESKIAPSDYRLYEPFFDVRYQPQAQVVAATPVRELDFSAEGAYSVYNWELFYHAPMAIAVHLSRNRRFEEAQQWLHYLFDPTDATEGPIERFWKVKPLQLNEVEVIGEIMETLADSTQATPEQLALRQRTINAIAAWRRNPFRPHLVARTRPGAYKVRTLMAYLDNLIAWGDSLFQQDTAETLDEAAMLYVRAAQLLGPRPPRTPRRGSLHAQSYKTLRKDLDEFGNAMRKLEADLAFNLAPLPATVQGEALANLRSIGQSLYFCVPGNDKLLAYWDTVADRLFKIHNSLNFQGVFRQLPLFDPPIDPALLARGVAAGLDLATVVAGTAAPLSPMRFGWWIRHALELCQEVRTLGAALLQAMEKEDAEALSTLRAKHETSLLGAMEAVRYGQFAESRKNREGVERSLAAATQRFQHFEQLLGRKPDEVTLPELEALHAEGLAGFKFKNLEPEAPVRAIDYERVEGIDALTGGRVLNRHEVAEMLLSRASGAIMARASRLDGTAALFGAMPNISFNGMFWGIGPTVQFGPQQIASAVQSMAASARAAATIQGVDSQDASRVGGFARREQEWASQSNAAAGEIGVLYKQLRAAQIREAITELEWENHQKQLAFAQEVERFLSDERGGRLTHQALYSWMRRETRALYGKALDLATDVARKAERSMSHELGETNTYISKSYSGDHDGLLAGERLALDLRRMELAFRERSVRELEVKEDVSLLQLDPRALVELRTRGECEIQIDEAFLDRRTPGHYFRRLKTVSVSIPCITGPHTRVHCTLRLLGSRIRIKPERLNNQYQMQPEDRRFQVLPAGSTAIVTSGAQSDEGLFPAAPGEERYLPFEGHGAVSRWKIELPKKLRDFDYNSISDLMLHLQYTAREGIPESLVTEAVLAQLSDKGSSRLFSLAEEFPDAWSQVVAALHKGDFASVRIALTAQHYPYWAAALGKLEIATVDIFALAQQAPELRVQVEGAVTTIPFAEHTAGRLHVVSFAQNEARQVLPTAVGSLGFEIGSAAPLIDLFVVVTWRTS